MTLSFLHRSVQRHSYPPRLARSRIAVARSPALLSSRVNKFYHAAPTTQSTKSSSRISTVFGVLITVGVATTAFGLYEFYTSFTMWPKEVRSDLRAGIKAKHQGDLDLSARYFQRAWETAQSLPLSEFGSAPHLKTTGILITLAEVLESNNKPRLAYELMAKYLDNLPSRDGPETDPESSTSKWSGPERMRLVAIAYKLGEMANTYSQLTTEEERWLVWSVQELSATLKKRNKTGHAEIPPTLRELELPNWVTKTDVAAPIQALGEYFSRVGKTRMAAALYISTLEVLLPDDLTKATPIDRCRGAQVLSNLAELMTRRSFSPEPGEESKNLEEAEEWALTAARLVAYTVQDEDATGDLSTCEEVFTVILANLGTIKMMKGEVGMGKAYYELALTHALKTGYKSHVAEVRRLLKEAERAGSNNMSEDSK